MSIALLAVRAIGASMLACAAALILATVVSLPLADGDRAEWAAPLSGISFRLALILIAASAGGFLLMPSRRDMVRVIPLEAGGSIVGAALLIPLFVATILQAPLLSTWWAQTRMALDEIVGNDPDPLGLLIIPTLVVFLLPGLAAATLLLFATTSILGTAVRRDMARRVVAACAFLQGGLVVSSYTLRQEVYRLGAAVVEFVQSAGGASASGAEWLARHDLLAGAVNRRLTWLMAGYLAALALLETTAPEPRTAASTAATPAMNPDPGLAFSSAARSIVSRAATAFDQATYTVRPRTTMIESLVGRRYSEYEIQSVPPSSQKYFSLSWTTGILRQEPNGPDLLMLQPARKPKRLFPRTYVVADATSGSTLGSLVPMGVDWKIVDACGHLLAHVVEMRSGYAAAIFIVKVGEQEVCRYTWGIQGATVRSAALDVEFLPAPGATFDRSFALALAPILEQKARLTSEWYA